MRRPMPDGRFSEQHRRNRGKNLATLGGLLAVAVLLFAVTVFGLDTG